MTELTELHAAGTTSAGADATDLLLVTDVSDTTASADGTSKAIRAQHVGRISTGAGVPASAPAFHGHLYGSTDGRALWAGMGTASAADFIPVHTGPLFTPEQYGADPTGATSSSTAFNAMIAAVNAGSGPVTIRLAGSYAVANPTAVTRADVTIDATGATITKNGNLKLIEVSGARCRIVGGEWNGASGAGYTGAGIVISGAGSGVTGAWVHDVGGIGISLRADTVAPYVDLCLIEDTGAGGVAAGRTTGARVTRTRVARAGAEGIQCDQIINGYVGYCETIDCGGGSGVGADAARGLVIEACVSEDNTSGGAQDGIRIFDNRPDATTPGAGSTGVVIAFCRTSGNSGRGIRLRNAYRAWPIDAINLGSVTTVEFRRFTISGVTLASGVVRITSTAHGLTLGTWWRGHTNNIVGTTELNGVIYWWQVVDANTLQAYGEVTGAAIDGSAGFTTYVSGGTLNHGFESGDRMRFTDAGGVTELEAAEYLTEPTTGSVLFSVTLENADGSGADIDSTAFTAYSSGGSAYAGGRPDGVTLIGNSFGTGADANTLGDYVVDFAAALASPAHYIAQGQAVESVAGLVGPVGASGLRAALNVEDGSTGDQSAAEIATAYNSEVAIVSQSDAEAGTSTTAYRWTPQRVAQSIAALETGGGGSVTSGDGAPSATPSGVGAIYVDTTGDIAYVATGTASSADWDPITSTVLGAPGADRLLGYDHSATEDAYFTPTGALTISGTNVTVSAASASAAGVVELATVAEADTGTDTARAVTPAGLAKRVISNPAGITGADAITNIVSLTQAEYDAITPNASTLYVITA